MGAAATIEPATLPIATRAWCARAPGKAREAKGMAAATARPRKFIAVHIAAGAGAHVIGAARIGTTHDWRTTREIWFHGPAASSEEVAALRKFAVENTLPRGSAASGGGRPDSVWRDEPRVRVATMALADFVKLFYAVMREDRALAIDFDLLSVFGALACRWGRKRCGGRGQYRRNSWSLVLLADRNPRTGKVEPAPFLPRVLIDRLAGGSDIVSLGSIRGGKGRAARGEFLDLSTLGYAISGDRREFGEAVEDFTGKIVGDGAPASGRGAGFPEGMRTAGRALVTLAETLVGTFDLLHKGLSRGYDENPGEGTLSETKAFGPGGIARAYAAAAGYSPAPTVPPEMIGLAAAANHGAWAGIGVRGRVPIVETDFRRQYAMIHGGKGSAVFSPAAGSILSKRRRKSGSGQKP